MNYTQQSSSQITEEIIEEPLLETPQYLTQTQQTKTAPKIRIESLDVYRGLTMMGMILVDNLGPVDNPPWFLDHAPWDGLTPADLVFPAFLFIMGMAVPLAVSLSRPLRLKHLTRILGLFAIGFLLNLIGKKFNFEQVRILGILQRLSLCYAVVLLTHVVTAYGAKFARRLASLLFFGLYFVYLGLMLSFDGSQKMGPQCSKENNLTEKCNYVGYVDNLIFSEAHCWRGSCPDPQGIISTIGAMITTFIGYQFSLIMGRYKQFPRKLIVNWISIACLLGVVVYPMTLLMPLNKKLYSSSFTLIVIAISGASLTFFYLLVDILPKSVPSSKRGVQVVTAPLKWLGLNPLAIFVLMTLVTIFMRNYIFVDDLNLWTYFFRQCFGNWISNETVASTIYSCFFLIVWVVVAGIMHKFKFYVRL